MPCYLRGTLRITNVDRFLEAARQQHYAVIREGDNITIQKGEGDRYIGTTISVSELENLPVSNLSDLEAVKLFLNKITRQYTTNTVQALIRQKGWSVTSIKEEDNQLRIRIRS